jgi:spore cortex formation protein SpoVR/YcgB (stage V sporulation)
MPARESAAGQVQLRRAAHCGRRDAQRRHAGAAARPSDRWPRHRHRAGRKVLEYVQRVWRRPVVLKTVNERSEPMELTTTTP